MNAFSRNTSRRPSVPRGNADSRRTAHDSRRVPNVLTVLSLLTALWLLAQFALAYQGSNNLYPVTNYGMFASGGDEWPEVRYQLAGTRADGTHVEIAPEELALTRLQLHSHLVNHIGRSPDRLVDGADGELEAIARIWTQRHGTDLTELALWRLEYWPGAAGEPSRHEVARWEP